MEKGTDEIDDLTADFQYLKQGILQKCMAKKKKWGGGVSFELNDSMTL